MPVDRRRELLLPALERAPRLRVERREDLVELHGARHPRVGQRAAVPDRPGTAPVPRCELDVGLAEQRLLAQDRARVAGDGGELGLDSIVASVRLRCFGSRSLARTLPTFTPATRTSASRPSCAASGNATFNR